MPWQLFISVALEPNSAALELHSALELHLALELVSFQAEPGASPKAAQRAARSA